LATIRAVHLIGVFALYATKTEEAPGTIGATLQLGDERETFFRTELLNGRHYSDATDDAFASRTNGDGTSIATVGEIALPQGFARVDHLVIDVAYEERPRYFRFKDLGSPASFILFDVLFETEEPTGCPFHSASGGVGLSEVSAIVRVGDRVRLAKALDQLEAGLKGAADLDEARGQALTFLAMVTAATLELGGSREMHRVQLEAAREMDRLVSPSEIGASARRYVEEIAGDLFKPVASPSSHLVDRALAIVERNFARDLTDATVAAQLGLSTSHFRFLFREATGQPFHKYLVALRLEKARQMLLADDVPVSTVARAVGFAGLSHFSRAFAQRFQVSPTSIRRQGA
jgi:AraC-like DNA-binding protein